jgi:hypothetical protein
MAETAPDANWIECAESELSKLTKLYREDSTTYYGYL